LVKGLLWCLARAYAHRCGDFGECPPPVCHHVYEDNCRGDNRNARCASFRASVAKILPTQHTPSSILYSNARALHAPCEDSWSCGVRAKHVCHHIYEDNFRGDYQNVRCASFRAPVAKALPTQHTPPSVLYSNARALYGTCAMWRLFVVWCPGGASLSPMWFVF
jgi:hypothetical protein